VKAEKLGTGLQVFEMEQAGRAALLVQIEGLHYWIRPRSTLLDDFGSGFAVEVISILVIVSECWDLTAFHVTFIYLGEPVT
jgi:hypothetical protein